MVLISGAPVLLPWVIEPCLQMSQGLRDCTNVSTGQLQLGLGVECLGLPVNAGNLARKRCLFNDKEPLCNWRGRKWVFVAAPPSWTMHHLGG